MFDDRLMPLLLLGYPRVRIVEVAKTLGEDFVKKIAETKSPVEAEQVYRETCADLKCSTELDDDKTN